MRSFQLWSLTKSSRNVILSSCILWIGKNCFRLIVLDQLAHVKEGCFVTNPTRLLHVMRHNNNRVLVF